MAEITCLHGVAILEFRRTSEECNKKFNLLFKVYKIDKLTNDISREEMHECKFYESIDQFFLVITFSFVLKTTIIIIPL